MASIAYLGPRGTFSQAALIEMSARGLLDGETQEISTDSTPAALDAVRTGVADYACVPIENSIEGSVLPTLDSLANGSALQVFGEVTLDVAFTIAVLPGTQRADIRTVAAFPVAAAQVRRWLAENLPGATLVPAISNAGAAREVAAGNADAGVTTALAAELHALEALADGVVDEPNARTRFVLVGQPGRPLPATGADRTSVVLALANVPGALVSALSEFGERTIDLTRIESRPTRVELGTYVFFLDCVGHIDDGAVAEALKALHRRCADVRYLGSWPTGSPAGAVPPDLTELTDNDDAAHWLARLREGRR